MEDLSSRFCQQRGLSYVSHLLLHLPRLIAGVLAKGGQMHQLAQVKGQSL